MRVRLTAAAVLLSAVLTGCGAAARTYTRAQAYEAVFACMHRGGAKSVAESKGDQGTASFAQGGSIQWGYVMSGAKVADVFFTGVDSVASDTQARLNACLRPHGWKLG